MSYTWERIGRFSSRLEADAYCERNGVGFSDRQIRPSQEGEVDLSIRRQDRQPDYDTRKPW